MSQLALNQQHKLVLDFIKCHTIAVLSTVTPDCIPESAAIEYGETDNLELIFDVSTKFRKYQNLQKNTNVSVVIGWDQDITVQYEGKAFLLKGEELATYKTFYFRKNPDAQKWEKSPDIRYFKIIPTWIRYTDLNKKPWYIEEMTF